MRLLLLIGVVCAFAAAQSSPLLTQSPMLMAHDAATAYAGYAKGTVAGTPCYQWKTQAFNASAPFLGKAGQSPSGFTSLLNCGARALDLRLTKGGPCADKGIGQICMHHSKLQIEDQTFESELQTVVDWVNRYPTELVLMKLVPDNEGAPAAIQAALDHHGIAIIPLCAGKDIDSVWTVEYAHTKARLPGGGMLLGTFAPALSSGQPANSSCVDDNFVPSVAYHPKDPDGSFAALWKYANKTVSRTGRAGKFQEVQLMWQSAETFKKYMKAYPLDALATQPFKYGNLKSTQESSINEKVLARIASITGVALNWVKMNDLCLHGLEIATQLGTNVTKEQVASCIATCGRMDAQNTCVPHS